MAGHSKWANIKHRKARMDARKGKIFSKLTREIVMAAREGGGNPEANLRLRLAIQKARDANLPAENISRAIQRGTGEVEGVAYEELVYEGYGPGGAAIYVEIVTDNRNRTASEIRYLFSRYGGSMGEAGCVAWMFDKKGYVVIDSQATRKGEDELLMLALEAGAEDFRKEGYTYEVTTAPEDLQTVKEVFRERGVTIGQAEVTMVPKSTVPLSGKDAEQVLRLVAALEDHDDVQNVYSNFDIPEEEMERLA